MERMGREDETRGYFQRRMRGEDEGRMRGEDVRGE